MLLIARKNLFSERIRLAISVGGVALSVFLISILVSLYRGWDSKVGSFVENSNVDVWVASEGTTDFLSAASVLPRPDPGSLSAPGGVRQWSPLIVRPLSGIEVSIPRPPNFNADTATKMNVQLIGYDTQTGLGGPLKIVEGKSVPGPGEVIIDEALSNRYGVDVGDHISAGGRDWSIVGKSSGGNFVASYTVFVSLEQATETLKLAGLTTFVVIQLDPGVNPKQFASAVEQSQPGVKAFTRQEFADATRQRVLGDIIPILLMILGLAFIVGLAVAGLTIYTATVEKAREFGILKAVGFRNRYLYRLVFEQSLVTGGLGFIIGAGLTVFLGPFASDLVPQFVILVRWQDILGVLLATLLMSGIAGYVPVRRLATIDPTSVFKA